MKRRSYGKRGFIYFMIIFFMCGTLNVHAEAANLTMSDEELRLGHLFDHFMTESFVLLRDERASEKISEVVDRIVKATEHPGAVYRLRIINDHVPLVSAFPGYVYVSSGILDIIQSEDELASLLAHAIAHVTMNVQHRAYIDAFRKDQKVKFTGYILPILFFSGAGAAAIGGELASASEGLFLMGTGMFAFSAVSQAVKTSDSTRKTYIHNKLVPHIDLPDTKRGLVTMVFLDDVYIGYEKKDETQADNLSLMYLEKAGYDSRALAAISRRLIKAGKGFMDKGYTSHLFRVRAE